MATLHPVLPSLRHDAGYFREIDVIERLMGGLDDRFDIFHSLRLHSVNNGSDAHREIDVVVLGPGGDLVIIEIKAGHLQITDGQLIKLYDGHEHDVARQSKVQFASMVNSLSKAGLRARTVNCVVLPDFTVGDVHVASIPRERILDATKFDVLSSEIRSLMPADPTNSPREDIRRFLANEFRVTPDLRALGSQLREATHILADGLATWVPRISAPSGVIRIEATAGSGKTQLALKLLEQAASDHDKALYVCFNRTLADHVAQLAPPATEVCSFHELCVEHFRRTRSEPDFSQPGIFDTVVATYREDARKLSRRYGLLIIDEGQDFEPEWIECLVPQLNERGRFYLMEDAAQRIYERAEFDLPEAVTLHCDDNFRSPKQVIDVINALSLTSRPIVARSPYDGELPDFVTYDGTEDLIRKTRTCVEALVQQGIPLDDLAVLTGHGLKHSQLLTLDQIGSWRTHRFTGRYDRDGNALWNEGELLLESIYRFKGQSRAGIVLTEIDFEVLNAAARHKLFVGLTRAHVAVKVLITRRSEAAIAAVL